jgi:hypothetical protein
MENTETLSSPYLAILDNDMSVDKLARAGVAQSVNRLG